ncbi:hypothetical protein ROLI_026920 [Roseobacter fucihabitans]|uniref:HTH crp-type domain-containing protein n=1 Tax=Roseobacter fucihabitans TaxID=1537242 RepID=A0ABZ2BU86_9RHOB|nr:Crp/Fnr family transcriptional regulator [Roseobacter litoralis]
MNDRYPHKLQQTEADVGVDPGIFTGTLNGAILGGSLNALLCAEGAYIKRANKHSIIANEGSAQQGLIAVLNGMVKLSTSFRDGRTQIVGLRFPGEFITLLTQAEPWFARVEVVEDAALLVLGAEKTEKLRLESRQFNIDMSSHANREIGWALAHLVTLGRKSPIERLASLLIELNDRGMGVNDASGEIRIPISRGEIGDYIGLESETVSRQFTRLKSDGYISLLSPSRVVVRDWHSLAHLSNGGSIAAE